MPPAWTLGRELVSQSVDLSGPTPFEIADIAIPTDQVVVGSGVVVTEVWDPVARVLRTIDSAGSDWPNRTNFMKYFHGPHPTDATKWRFILDNSGGDPIRVLAWFVVTDPLT
jgi:hypothetical protein